MTISWLNVQLLTNKIDVVTSTIADHSLDVFALSETGIQAATTLDFVLRRLLDMQSLMSLVQLAVEAWLPLSTVSTSRVHEYCFNCAPRSKRSASD